jgi:hypothetical protein
METVNPAKLQITQIPARLALSELAWKLSAPKAL